MHQRSQTQRFTEGQCEGWRWWPSDGHTDHKRRQIPLFLCPYCFSKFKQPLQNNGASRKSAVCPQELGIELLFPFLVNLSNTPLFLGQGNAPFYDRLMVVSRGASCWHLYLLRLNSWDVMQNVWSPPSNLRACCWAEWHPCRSCKCEGVNGCSAPMSSSDATFNKGIRRHVLHVHTNTHVIQIHCSHHL